MATQSVKIPVELEVQMREIGSQISKIQRAMEQVKPDTKGYRHLETMLKSMAREFENIKKQSSETFTTRGQIDTFGRKFEHLQGLARDFGEEFKKLDLSAFKDSAFGKEFVDKISNAQQSIEELQNKISQLGDEAFVKTVKSSQELADTLKELNAGSAESLVDEKKSVEALEKIKKSSKDLQEELRKATSDKNAKTSSRDRETRDLRKKEINLTAAKSEYAELQEAVAKAAAELENFKKVQESIQAQSLKKSSLDAEDRINRLNIEKANFRSKAGRAKNGEAFFGSKGDSFDKDKLVQHLIDDLAFTNEDLERAGVLSLTEQSLDAFYKNLAELLKEKKASFDAQISKIDKDVQDAERKLSGAQTKEASGKQALNEAQTAYNAQKAEVDRLAVEISNLEKRATEIQAKIDRNTAAANAIEKASADKASAMDTAPQVQEIQELKNRITALEQELRKSVSAYREVDNAAEEMSDGVDKAKRGTDGMKNSLEMASKSAQHLGSIRNAIRQWFGFNEVINLTKRAIRSAVENIKELDSVMTEIAVVTDMTQKELWDQIDTYSKMAQQYGVATSGVYEVSMLYYQQGLQTAEVMKMTEETLKMAKIAGLDYAEATDYMTVAIRGFKMEMSDAQRVVDVYSNLAAISASDTEELAVAMSKTASSAEAVGSSFENTSAMIALMVETTREAPENIGSALKSIISRFGEMTTDPTKLVDSEGEVMSLNKVDKALRSVGISLQDAQGNFRDFDDVILELSASWDTIDRNTQRYIATIMAGNRQQSRFLALVGNNERLVELSEEAANSEGAAAIQTAKTMDSIASKVEQVKTSLQQFYSSMGFEEMFKGALDWITKILNNINKMSKAQAFTSIFNIIKSLKNIIMGMFNLFEGRIQKISKGFQLNPDDKKARTIVELLGAFIDKTLTKAHIIKVDTKQAEAQIANLGNKASNPIVLNTSQLSDFSNLYDNHSGSRKKFGKTLTAQGIQGDIYSGYMYLFDQMRKDKTAFGKFNNMLLSDDIQDSDTFEVTAESLRKLGIAADKASGELRKIDGDENDNQTPGQKKGEQSAVKKTHAAATALTAVASVLSTAGAALTAAALAIKDSSKAATERSKTQSGLGNILSGVGAGIGTGITTGMAIGGPYGAIAGVILGAITSLLGGAGTGISQLIDGYNYTIKEKISNAEDQLNELRSIETQKKAEEASLKTSLSELKSLEKAQYDSAQAAQAYKGKMNEIAEKYPDLISGYDSAGNAIISAVQLEEKLAAARLATAQASDNASEKEWWIAELRRRGAETLVNSVFSPEAGLWETLSGEHTVSGSSLGDYLNVSSGSDYLSMNSYGNNAEWWYALDLNGEGIQEKLLNLYSMYGQEFIDSYTNLVFDEASGLFTLKQGETQAMFKRQMLNGSSSGSWGTSLTLEGMRSLIQRDVSGEQLPYNIFAANFFEDFFEGLKKIATDNGLKLEDYGIPISEIETALKNGTWTEEDSRRIYRQLFQNADDVLLNYTEGLVNQTLQSGQTSAKEALARSALTDLHMGEILEEYSGIFTSIGGAYLQQAYEDYKAAGHEDATWEDWKATRAASGEEYNYEDIQSQMLQDLRFIDEDLAQIWDNMDLYNPATLENELRGLGLDEKIIELILGIFNDTYSSISEIAGNRAANIKSDTARMLFHSTNNLGEGTPEEMVQRAYDRGFSLQDVGIYVDDAGLYHLMGERTAEQIENYNSLMTENVVSMFDTGGIMPDKALPAAFYDDTIQIFNLLDEFYNQGFTKYTDNLAIGISSVFFGIRFLPAEYLEEATSILDNLDFSNLEEIIQAKEQFQNLNVSGQYTDIIQSLQFVIQASSSQVDVLGQLTIDKAISVANKISGFFENVIDGFDSLEEAYKAFDGLESYDSLLEGKNFNDFFRYDNELNKWVLNTQGLSLIMSEEIQGLAEENARLQNLQTEIKTGNFTVDYSSLDFVYDGEEIDWDKSLKDDSGDWNDKYLNLDQRTQEFLIWAKNNGKTNLDEAWNAYIEYLKEQIGSANLAFQNALIDIRSNIENSIDFNSLVSGEATAEQMTQSEGLLKAYFSTLASTMDFIDSEGNLLEGAQLEAARTAFAITKSQTAIKKLLYQDYEAFERITGITLTTAEEMELISTQAESELELIQKLTTAKMGEWVDISHLVDMFGEENLSGYFGEIKDGFTQISEDTKIFDLIGYIKNSADYLALDLYQLQDALHSYFTQISDLLTDGLSGELTFEGLEQLKAQFPELELNYRETAEGLKLSEGSVLQIYGKLKEVDSLAAEITLDGLIETTMDAEEGMNNIYNVLGRIADLNEKISQAEYGSERQKALALELELAEGIRDTLLEAGNAFNFMDQDLPTSLSNPLSLWDGVGDALTILDGDEFKNGLGSIDFTDFYNLINMMDQTGVDLKFAAQGFGEDADLATELIMAAGKSLTIVDGKPIVDLSKMGEQFNLGTEGMRAGLAEGIQTLAQNEIDMIDAAISLLETIVAMEEIGDIDVDKNGLNMEELFVLDEKGNATDFQEGVTDSFEATKKGLEEIGINASEVKIGAFTLEQLLVEDFDAYKELEAQWGITQDQYFKFIKGITDTVNSKDFDPNDLPGMFKLMGQNIGEEISINTDQFSIKVTPSGDFVYIDWTAEDIAQKVKEAGFNSVEQAQEAVTRYLNGESQTDLEFRQTLSLLGRLQTIDGTYVYIGSDGNRYEYSEPPTSEEIVQRENQIFADRMTGTNGQYTYTDGSRGQLRIESEGITVDYFISTNEDGSTTIHYNGQEFETTEALEEYIVNNAAIQPMIAERGTTPIEVQGKAYTKITLATGDTVWQAEDGSTITNAGMSQLMAEEVAAAGGGEVQQIPVDAGLTVSTVTGVSLGEGAIPEEGLTLTDPITEIKASVTTLTLGLSEEGSISLDETTLTLIQDYNDALSTAADLSTVNSNITVTLTGLTTEDVTLIKDYNDASSAINTEVTSTVNGSITIPQEVLLNILSLKEAVLALQANPNISTSFAAIAEENALALIRDILAVYGYSGQTAELIFNALDNGTIANIVTQLDAITDEEIQITAKLNDTAAQRAIDDLTKPEFKKITITYDAPSTVGPGPDTSSSGYYVSGIENSSGNKTKVGQYSTLSAAADDITAKVENGTFQNGTFEITEISADGTTLTTTATLAELIAGTVNFSGTISTGGVGGSTPAPAVATPSVSMGPISLPSVDTTQMMSSIQSAANTISSKIATAGSEGAASAASAIKSTLNSIKGKTVTVKVNAPSSVSISASLTATIRVKATGGTLSSLTSNKGSVSGDTNTITGTSPAKGNVALAKGSNSKVVEGRTLMGELGPELVVSGGRYYTVGNNGAEFVDLPKDAIVFNHLQTKKLLGSGKGMIGTGEPVTNERNAVAFASGNVSGPAMASASDALAELYKLRAMWQGLLDAAASELGGKAGGQGLGSGKGPGSGGGGGGGGGGGSGEEVPSVVGDLDRWYNLLRQIAKLEQQITYEQAKRENMRSGYDRNDSLEKQLKLLKKQYEAQKKLSKIQKSYYDARRKDLEATDYSMIFTYDEDGLMQYVDGQGRGLDILATLNKTDKNGKAVYNAKQQLDYLKNVIKFDTSVLKTNADGTTAKTAEEQMQNFWDGVDGWMEEMDSLYDSYNEAATAMEEATSAMNEILNEQIENQLTVEEKLLKAIEARQQAEIDRIQDEKDALEEAAQQYIDGLNSALEQERSMYEKNESDAETSRLQRQLAILQRSGGSASDIKSLQDQIDSRLKDAYFQEQQDQIDAIQEASDNQLEKLQTQIDIMTEALEYQKQNGLLWAEVIDMMQNWTPEEMMAFIEQFDPDYKTNSPTQNQQNTEETLSQIQQWVDYNENNKRKERQEKAWNDYYENLEDYSEDVKKQHAEGAKKAFEAAYGETEDINAAKKAADEYYAKATAPAPSDGDGNDNPDPPASTPVTGKGTVNTKKSNLNVRKGPGTGYGIMGSLKKGKTVTLTGYKDGWYKIDYNGKDGYVSGSYIKTNDKNKLSKFEKGGLVDFTGPAWVDGTKSKPEAFLSAEDTKMLKSKIFSNSDGSLQALVAALEAITGDTSKYSANTSTESIIIQNAQVNIQPGVISNDYDARRAGEMALEEMVKIARKTTNRVMSK